MRDAGIGLLSVRRTSQSVAAAGAPDLVPRVRTTDFPVRRRSGSEGHDVRPNDRAVTSMIALAVHHKGRSLTQFPSRWAVGNDHRIGCHREVPAAACRSSKRGPDHHAPTLHSPFTLQDAVALRPPACSEKSVAHICTIHQAGIFAIYGTIRVDRYGRHAVPISRLAVDRVEHSSFANQKQCPLHGIGNRETGQSWLSRVDKAWSTDRSVVVARPRTEPSANTKLTVPPCGEKKS